MQNIMAKISLYEVGENKNYLNDKWYCVIFGWNMELDMHMLLGADIAGSFLVIHELNSDRLHIKSIINT